MDRPAVSASSSCVSFASPRSRRSSPAKESAAEPAGEPAEEPARERVPCSCSVKAHAPSKPTDGTSPPPLRRPALRQQYVGPALRVIMWAFMWAVAYGARFSRAPVWDQKPEKGWFGAMSKRAASYFVRVLGVLVLPLALVGLTASPGSAATAKSPTFFGAKLTSQSQPSNAQNGQACDESAGIPSGSWCTWVAITAFENGSHFTAPVTGTVKHVKLVSCVKGKFRLLLAQANPSARKARIVTKGPEINYVGQSPCGGTSGQQYVVQS